MLKNWLLSWKAYHLKIATKVSSTGTIFGSVGNIQIAEELAKLGHNIDRKDYRC